MEEWEVYDKMEKRKLSIFWFRRDLRLEDNCGLYHALTSDYPVFPIFVFDTNILSELMRSEPDQSVLRWIATQKATNLFITALTQAEVLYGLELLPEGKRRRALIQAAKSMFDLDFAQRILAFDSNAAQQFAVIAVKRRKIGRPISQFDAQIAAISWCNNASLATRNISDFEQCDLALINPWEL